MRPKFGRQNGKNLSKTKRQGPGGPTIPAGHFLSIEKWPRQRAATDREVWTNRQAAEVGGKRELGERQANKETNKQRARQAKGPSAGDRQTGERKLTEALVLHVSGWMHVKGPPSVSVSQGLCWNVSLRASGAVCSLCPNLSIFLRICALLRPLYTLSLTSQSPCLCPIPAAPSVPGRLSDLPFTLLLREIQTFPVGFGRLPKEPGQSSRDGQKGQGFQFRGQLLACRREKAVR